MDVRQNWETKSAAAVVIKTLQEFGVVSNSQNLINEVLKPNFDAFRENVCRDRRVGRRRRERQKKMKELKRHSIPRKTVEEELGVNPSTFSRWLNGETVSDNFEQIDVIYRSQLENLEIGTNELSIAGYTHAIEQCRERILEHLGRPLGDLEFDDESFCLLWTAYRTREYWSALNIADLDAREKELKRALVLIYEKIKTEEFPSCNLTDVWSPNTVQEIRGTWSLAFRLVVYSCEDFLSFVNADQ